MKYMLNDDEVVPHIDESPYAITAQELKVYLIAVIRMHQRMMRSPYHDAARHRDMFHKRNRALQSLRRHEALQNQG